MAAFDGLAAHAGSGGMHLFWRHSGLKRVPQTATAIDPRINRAFTDLLKVNMLLLQWVEMSGPTSASDSADLPSADLQQPKPPQSQSRPATTNRSNKGGTPSSKIQGRLPKLLLTQHAIC